MSFEGAQLLAAMTFCGRRYSAYFTQLNGAVQDEVIARTKLNLADM
jgi:hypothetical protein